MTIKTKEQLLIDLNAHYPTNAQGQIAASDHRAQQTDVIDTLATEVYVDDTDVANSVTDQAYADSAVATHAQEPDPHGQYALEAEVLETFSLAGYGGIVADESVAPTDIGLAWELFDAWDGAALPTPRYIVQDFANNGIRIERPGVFSVNIKISLQHAESQGGRVMYLRLWNATAGTPGASEFAFGVGRNVAFTNLTVPGALFDVTEETVGDLIQIQIGGGDSFTAVTNIGASFEASSVSEARGLEEVTS